MTSGFTTEHLLHERTTFAYVQPKNVTKLTVFQGFSGVLKHNVLPNLLFVRWKLHVNSQEEAQLAKLVSLAFSTQRACSCAAMQPSPCVCGPIQNENSTFLVHRDGLRYVNKSNQRSKSEDVMLKYHCAEGDGHTAYCTYIH